MDFLYEGRSMNTKLFNDGYIGDWEIKHVSINKHDIKIKDNERDQQPRSTIPLNSIVLIQDNNIDLGLTPQSNESRIIKIKPSSISPFMWAIEMESQDMYDRWTKEIIKKSRPGSDVESQSPTSSYKYASYFKGPTTCEGIWVKGYKFWLYLGFSILTVILVVLFSCLWVFYVSPLYGIDGVETTCKIDSSDWGFLSSDYYNYYIEATYTIESGEILTNKATEVCYGFPCTWELGDNYAVGSNKTCHYDRDNVDFVYFDLFDTKYYRLVITFSICGCLFFIWLVMILLIVMFYIKSK